MPKAAIITKPQKPEMQSILPELVEWLSARGYEAVLDPESAAYLDRSDQAVERNDMPEQQPEVVISLGGDGTLLSAARAFSDTDTPIIGVNLGWLGFLTEVTLAELYQTLEAWQNGTAFVDKRRLMHAERPPTAKNRRVRVQRIKSGTA